MLRHLSGTFLGTGSDRCSTTALSRMFLGLVAYEIVQKRESTTALFAF